MSGPYRKVNDESFDLSWDILDGDETVIASLQTEGLADDLLTVLNGGKAVDEETYKAIEAVIEDAFDDKKDSDRDDYPQEPHPYIRFDHPFLDFVTVRNWLTGTEEHAEDFLKQG